MFTVKELFKFKLLSVPDAETIKIPQEWDGITDSPLKKEGGVYVFYSSYEEALYIGISSNIHNRIKDHLQTGKGNKDLNKYFVTGSGLVLDVFYENNKAHQEIYESYLIYQLKPRFNIGKTGRHRIDAK